MDDAEKLQPAMLFATTGFIFDTNRDGHGAPAMTSFAVTVVVLWYYRRNFLLPPSRQSYDLATAAMMIFAATIVGFC